jgi:predicted house-cleaning NTP pyrophosphatase (Maf/HAM1 superfamily)
MGEPQQQVTQWLTAEQAQQMVADALAHAAAQAAASAIPAEGTLTAAQVQAIVDEALARQAETYNTQIEQLAASMRGNIITFIPKHAGGHNTSIAETWSQLDQQRAYAADEAALLAAANA